MKKIRVLLMENNLEALLRRLQDLESVHLVSIKERLIRWENLIEVYPLEKTGNPRSGEQQFELNIKRTFEGPIEFKSETGGSFEYTPFQEIDRWERVKNQLDTLVNKLELDPEPGFLDQYIKQREIKLVPVSPDEEENLLQQAEEIIDNSRRQVESIIDKYSPVKTALQVAGKYDFDIDLIKGSDNITVIMGFGPAENLQILERDLAERLPYARIYSEGRGRNRYVFVVSLRLYRSTVIENLENRGFEIISIPEELKGSIPQVLTWIERQIVKVREDNRETLFKLSDAVGAKIDRLMALEKLGKTGNIVALEGWVPENKVDVTLESITQAVGGVSRVLVTDPDEHEENIPTLLEGLFEPFSSLVETYDVPRYNEVDPSPFMAFFFTFFVGLMIGDAALGILVTAIGIIFLRGAGSRSEGMNNLSKVVIVSGISSVFFGLITGQFMFGVLEEFTGGAVQIPVLWLNPADDPLGFLPITLLMGVIHLGSGVMVGLTNNLVHSRVREIIGDQVSTSFLIGGVGILAATGQFRLMGWGLLGYSIIVLGVASLIFGHGPSGLLELTSILSNLISYIRLLALNMATTWMGRTFVLLSGMILPVAYLGLPLAILLMLFSQFFMVFISSFSTFAHALRLHYVEFFGNFFMGGGTKFSPLKADRRYTLIRGEL